MRGPSSFWPVLSFSMSREPTMDRSRLTSEEAPPSTCCRALFEAIAAPPPASQCDEAAPLR